MYSKIKMKVLNNSRLNLGNENDACPHNCIEVQITVITNVKYLKYLKYLK